jgi:hypothetical protein
VHRKNPSTIAMTIVASILDTSTIIAMDMLSTFMEEQLIEE